jgi:hypothetical protein
MRMHEVCMCILKIHSYFGIDFDTDIYIYIQECLRRLIGAIYINIHGASSPFGNMKMYIYRVNSTKYLVPFLLAILDMYQRWLLSIDLSILL